MDSSPHRRCRPRPRRDTPRFVARSGSFLRMDHRDGLPCHGYVLLSTVRVEIGCPAQTRVRGCRQGTRRRAAIATTLLQQFAARRVGEPLARVDRFAAGVRRSAAARKKIVAHHGYFMLTSQTVATKFNVHRMAAIP